MSDLTSWAFLFQTQSVVRKRRPSVVHFFHQLFTEVKDAQAAGAQAGYFVIFIGAS